MELNAPASRREVWIGLALLALALVTLFAWIPLDIESGVIEKVRRREKLGDAFFPATVSIALALVALAHLVGALRGRAGQPPAEPETAAAESPSVMQFVVPFAGIVCVSLLLMVHSGPLLVAELERAGVTVASYRELRDTVPYKYIGFAAGGGLLVAGLVALLEGRLRSGAVLTALVAVTVLIATYDLPFDDLLLPPNGDQ